MPKINPWSKAQTHHQKEYKMKYVIQNVAKQPTKEPRNDSRKSFSNKSFYRFLYTLAFPKSASSKLLQQTKHKVTVSLLVKS